MWQQLVWQTCDCDPLLGHLCNSKQLFKLALDHLGLAANYFMQDLVAQLNTYTTFVDPNLFPFNGNSPFNKNPRHVCDFSLFRFWVKQEKELCVGCLFIYLKHKNRKR